MGAFWLLWSLIRALFSSPAALAAENLVFRQQVIVLRRSVKRPRQRNRDRLFWGFVCRVWKGWRSSLHILQPAIVTRWHRAGFKRYWRWRSHSKTPGRSKIDPEIRLLIKQMSRENPLWGAPRILSELQLLGYEVAERTVAKYMVRDEKPLSQTWRTFLDDHLQDIVAINIFTVPTVTFRVLYGFVVLRHRRHRRPGVSATLPRKPVLLVLLISVVLGLCCRDCPAQAYQGLIAETEIFGTFAPGSHSHILEAETLLGTDAFSDSDGLAVNSYVGASGGKVLVFGGKPNDLTWRPQIKVGGTYRFWLRARSGWNENKYMTLQEPVVHYQLRLGSRPVSMEGDRASLCYYDEHQNYAWFVSEPLNLDPGPVSLHLKATWGWSTLDVLMLTDDPDYKAPSGNLAKRIRERKADWELWAADPYLAFEPTMQKPEDAAPPRIDLYSTRTSTAYGAFAIHNKQTSPGIALLQLRMPQLRRADGAAFPAQHVSLRRLRSMNVMGRDTLVAADAIPEINDLGCVEVAPGYSAFFWLFLKIPQDVAPGLYEGAVTIEDQFSLKVQSVPVRVEVSPVAPPSSTDLAVFMFGHDKSREGNEIDLRRGLNCFMAVPYSLLEYRFDAEGKLVDGVRDTKALVEWAALQSKSGGYLLVEWYLHHAPYTTMQNHHGGDRGSPLALHSPPWKRAFRTLLVALHDSLEAKGVPRDRILHYIYDEYLGEKFVETAKVIRAVNKEYRIFADLLASLEDYQRVAPYVDVWCPHFGGLEAMAEDGRLELLKSTGGDIWFYDCGRTQRRASPYAAYRHKFWRVYRYGLQGCTYHVYRSGRMGDYYAIRGGPAVHSRRYEAWFTGLQDYKLLKMLEGVAEGGTARAEAAAALLEESVTAVTASPRETGLAETFRHKMIRLLEQSGSNR